MIQTVQNEVVMNKRINYAVSSLLLLSALEHEANLSVTRHYVVSTSTRSMPVANTDAGQPPSSEELSEPLTLAALGAAGAVESETCVPICDRSPCAEPEVKFQDVSFCSYGRR